MAVSRPAEREPGAGASPRGPRLLFLRGHGQDVARCTPVLPLRRAGGHGGVLPSLGGQRLGHKQQWRRRPRGHRLPRPGLAVRGSPPAPGVVTAGLAPLTLGLAGVWCLCLLPAPLPTEPAGLAPPAAWLGPWHGALPPGVAASGQADGVPHDGKGFLSRHLDQVMFNGRFGPLAPFSRPFLAGPTGHRYACAATNPALVTAGGDAEGWPRPRALRTPIRRRLLASGPAPAPSGFVQSELGVRNDRSHAHGRGPFSCNRYSAGQSLPRFTFCPAPLLGANQSNITFLLLCGHARFRPYGRSCR